LNGLVEVIGMSLYLSSTAVPKFAMEPIPIYWDTVGELMGTKRYDDALQLLTKATDLFPNVPLLLFEKAVAFYAKGDVASARAVTAPMKSMGRDVTDDPFFLSFFGLAAVLDGHPEEGAQTLDVARNNMSSRRWCWRFAML
jgi:hypothetical protein